MNSIVFDLELVKRYKKGQPSEIVEIGACRVDRHAKIIVDQFQQYVLPKSKYVSKSTRKFIHMDKKDLQDALPFIEAIKAFSDWIGEEHYLCSWGKDDKLHMVDQCRRNYIRLEWFKHYNDIQKPIGRMLDQSGKNQMGLKTALQLAGIGIHGQAHRGIDDAVNTATLFLQYMDHIELLTNTVDPETGGKPATV